LQSLVWQMQKSEPPEYNGEPDIWRTLGVAHIAPPELPYKDPEFLGIQDFQSLREYMAKVFPVLATAQTARMVLVQMARQKEWRHPSDLLNLMTTPEPAYYFVHDKLGDVICAMRSDDGSIGYIHTYGRAYDASRFAHAVFASKDPRLTSHYLKHCTQDEKDVMKNLLHTPRGDPEEAQRWVQSALERHIARHHATWDDLPDDPSL
jgi:hypothetical protein